MWRTGNIYPVRFTLGNVITILTVCDFPLHHFLSSVGFCCLSWTLFFPHLSSTPLTFYGHVYAHGSPAGVCSATATWGGSGSFYFSWFWEVRLQYLNKPGGGSSYTVSTSSWPHNWAYSISNITLHLLFMKKQERKEREKGIPVKKKKKKKLLMKKLKYDSLLY